MAPTRLFLSYSHQDIAWCSEFVSALRKHGIQIWFDRDELRPDIGEMELQQALSGALDSSLLVVMVYSPHSRASTWVAWELLQRQDRKRLVILHDAPIGMVGAF